MTFVNLCYLKCYSTDKFKHIGECKKTSKNTKHISVKINHKNHKISIKIHKKYKKPSYCLTVRCNNNYEPVCGYDNITYKNKC